VATKVIERESGAPPLPYENILDDVRKADLENVSKKIAS
jgi:hypothetical protein